MNRRSTPTQIAIVLLGPVLATVAQLWLMTLLPGTKLVLFYPLVIWTSWFIGFPAAMLATALSCVLASVLIVGPTMNSWMDFMPVVFFFAINFLVAYFNQRLRNSERRFMTIFENAPFGITLVRYPATTIVDVNPAFVDLTGYTREEVIGKTSLELGLHADIEARLKLAEEFRAKGRIRHGISRIRTKSGREIIVSNNIDRVEFEGEAFLLTTTQDITEQKFAEMQLREAIAARDEFLSIASHELKTPLTSLRLQVQSIQRNLKRNDPEALSNERMLKFVEQSDRQTIRLARLVDDMLDVARIRSGKLTIETHELDLCDIILEVIDRLLPQFIHAGGAAPKLEFAEPLRGYWDRFRIEQIMTNLLINAAKYGQGKPFEVRAERRGGIARVIVHDYGIGIAKENQERIFNRFERAIAPGEVSGLGLGLFITKQIVDLHQGRIWVESELGQGSSFIVELPIETAAKRLEDSHVAR